MSWDLIIAYREPSVTLSSERESLRFFGRVSARFGQNATLRTISGQGRVRMSRLEALRMLESGHVQIMDAVRGV